VTAVRLRYSMNESGIISHVALLGSTRPARYLGLVDLEEEAEKVRFSRIHARRPARMSRRPYRPQLPSSINTFADSRPDAPIKIKALPVRTKVHRCDRTELETGLTREEQRAGQEQFRQYQQRLSEGTQRLP